MAPLGELVLKGFNSFMEWISGLDPANLQLIVTGFIGLAVAFQLAVGVFALIAGGAAALSNPVSAAIFIIGLLAVTMIALYNRFPVFRKIVDTVIKAVVKAFNWMRDIIVDKVIPGVMAVLEVLWKGIQYLWEYAKPYLEFLLEFWTDVFEGVAWVINTFVMPVLAVLWDAIKYLWDKVVKPYLGFIIGLWTKVFKAAWWVIKNILLPVIDLIGKTIIYLWRKQVKPMITAIKEGWEVMSEAFDKAYKDYIKPAFDALANYLKDEVEPKFRTAVGVIKGIWEGLKEAFAVPIRFLINTVLNDGLIAGFNWIARKVDATEIKPIPLPEFAQQKTAKATGGMLPWGKQSRAVGGTLPGYNPGRDNFTFYNPRLGELNLSGGEGILRPEVVRAAGGSQWIDGLNHAAMQGGVGGVQKKLFGSYWLGGTIPLAGASVSSHGATYGYPAFDLNYPGYDDYGKPVVAFKDGVITALRYIGDTSYGRYATINHGSQTSLYAHLSAFASNLAEGMAVRAGTPIGYVGDIGKTGTPPTSHLHFEIRGGSPDFGDVESGTRPKSKMPNWAKTILSSPLDWMKGLITKPMDKLREKFGTNDLSNLLGDTALTMAKRSVKFVKDLIPAKDAWDALVGNPSKDNIQAPTQEPGVPGLPGGNTTPTPVSAWTGGILPYNGTMKYDAGGYLPPGLTTVMNLTGKPEPVFTADQFADLGISGGDSQSFTYAPTIQGSNLTAADLVTDMDRARRKVAREGRYGRNK